MLQHYISCIFCFIQHLRKICCSPGWVVGHRYYIVVVLAEPQMAIVSVVTIKETVDSRASLS